MSRPISDPVFDIGRDLQRAYDEGYKQGRYDEKVETETSLPSKEKKMNRQRKVVITVTYNEMGIIVGTKVEELGSSAQPENIRCKDCKYWEQNAQHGFDEDNEEYHNYCARLVPDDDYYAFTREANDFCSYAERRADE